MSRFELGPAGEVAGSLIAATCLVLLVGCSPTDTRRNAMNQTRIDESDRTANPETNPDSGSRYEHREPSVDSKHATSKMTIDIDDDPNRGKPKHGLSKAEQTVRVDLLKQTIRNFEEAIVGDEVVAYSKTARHEAKQSTIEVTLKDGRRFTLTGVFKNGKVNQIKVFETGKKFTINDLD